MEEKKKNNKRIVNRRITAHYLKDFIVSQHFSPIAHSPTHSPTHSLTRHSHTTHSPLQGHASMATVEEKGEDIQVDDWIRTQSTFNGVNGVRPATGSVGSRDSRDSSPDRLSGRPRLLTNGSAGIVLYHTKPYNMSYLFTFYHVIPHHITLHAQDPEEALEEIVETAVQIVKIIGC